MFEVWILFWLCKNYLIFINLFVCFIPKQKWVTFRTSNWHLQLYGSLNRRWPHLLIKLILYLAISIRLNLKLNVLTRNECLWRRIIESFSLLVLTVRSVEIFHVSKLHLLYYLKIFRCISYKTLAWYWSALRGSVWFILLVIILALINYLKESRWHFIRWLNVFCTWMNVVHRNVKVSLISSHWLYVWLLLLSPSKNSAN